MKKRLGLLAIVVSALGSPVWLRGDDLTGQQLILCTAVQAAYCDAEGDCRNVPPWDLNIPQFLEVNLKDKSLSTTRASGENRTTPIKVLSREGDMIFLQGIEGARAFSIVIAEKDGFLSAAVARDGWTVSVFGACTPIPAGK